MRATGEHADPAVRRILEHQRSAGNAAVVQLIAGAAYGAAQGTPDTDAARAVFQRGADAYAADDFAHAYDEFSRAYELDARPGLLFIRAQALRRLGGRREEAIAL